MPIRTYLWLEDRKGKASYIFWEHFMRVLYPDVIVESKKNNSELVKAVRSLTDDINRYIIVFDNSFDNFQAYQELKLLEKYVNDKSNISIMNIICFEYLLLEFDQLIQWIYAPDDDFRLKRATAILARDTLVGALKSGDLNYRALRDVVEYDRKLDDHNIEQLSAKLLFDLTRNTGFEVSKGNIGECWIQSCCDWTRRQPDDICGLDSQRLSIDDKMKRIYAGTSLCRELPHVGLEATVL